MLTDVLKLWTPLQHGYDFFQELLHFFKEMISIFVILIRIEPGCKPFICKGSRPFRVSWVSGYFWYNNLDIPFV